MWKLTWASFIPVWHYDFIPSFHEVTLHVVLCNRDAILGCRKLRMRHPLQTPGRVIFMQEQRVAPHSHDIEMSFVSEWKSRSGTMTGVNSHWFDSHRYEILCRCHVNKYRATRGNRSELVPEWKSHREHVNTSFKQSFKSTANLISASYGLKTVVSLLSKTWPFSPGGYVFPWFKSWF